MNGAYSRRANEGDKKTTIVFIVHILSELASHLYQIMLKGWNLHSLMASIAAIIKVDDINGADLQSSNAKNVKKILQERW